MTGNEEHVRLVRPHFVVTPRKGYGPSWRDLVAFREVLFFLIWRDIKVRYRQSLFGIAWAVLQPLILMLVFAFFFGYLGGLSSGGVPYPVFVLAALLPWQLFANSLASAASSLVTNQDLITKVYFPRAFVVFSSIGVGLIDFAFAFALLVGFLVFYDIDITLRLLLVPVVVTLAVAMSLGASLWFAALNARYRDVQIAIPFLVQTWMFASPIAYATDIVPEAWRSLYAVNPMVGVIDGIRWAVFGEPALSLGAFGISCLAVAFVLVTGWMFFHRTEHSFADVL
ncbi:MAG TPA: ABC transporter permease [Kiloniellaceae bacterium]|nr:ABC transporter permease [Kiloniellaceae bacterium]